MSRKLIWTRMEMSKTLTTFQHSYTLQSNQSRFFPSNASRIYRFCFSMLRSRCIVKLQTFKSDRGSAARITFLFFQSKSQTAKEETEITDGIILCYTTGARNWYWWRFRTCSSRLVGAISCRSWSGNAPNIVFKYSREDSHLSYNTSSFWGRPEMKSHHWIPK